MRRILWHGSHFTQSFQRLSIPGLFKNIIMHTVWCHTADIGISNKVEYLGKEASYNYSTKEIV